jgi:hypothetical protein
MPKGMPGRVPDCDHDCARCGTATHGRFGIGKEIVCCDCFLDHCQGLREHRPSETAPEGEQ